MKLQGMSIIFALVCLPIILVIAYYISIQIDTITLQKMYDSKLLDATYDAMSAFELNTANEDLSSVADSLRTIIEASNNIFMNTLATNLGMSNASKSHLEPYIPSILYTLYDGYYIYAPTYAPTAIIDSDGNAVSVGDLGVSIGTNGNYSFTDPLTDNSYQTLLEKIAQNTATEGEKETERNYRRAHTLTTDEMVSGYDIRDYGQLLYRTPYTEKTTDANGIETQINCTTSLNPSKNDDTFESAPTNAKYKTQNVLKSYIPYSARYIQSGLSGDGGTFDVDINVIYTLDNYITIDGKFLYPDNKEIYYTKSGYLIPFKEDEVVVRIYLDEDGDGNPSNNNYENSLNYNQNEIQEFIEAGRSVRVDVLKDLSLETTDPNNWETIINITNANRAIIDTTGSNIDADNAKLTRYENLVFSLEEFKKKVTTNLFTGLTEDEIRNVLKECFEGFNDNDIWNGKSAEQIIQEIDSTEFNEIPNWVNSTIEHVRINRINIIKYNIQLNSAAVYYAKAAIFSDWVRRNLSGLQINSIQDISGVNYASYTEILDDDGEDRYLDNLWKNGGEVFDFSEGDNSFGTVEIKKDSSFYTHKLNVIRASIQYNLNLSMSAYNRHNYYYDDAENYRFNKNTDYAMPIMSEAEWDQILSNISIVSFMQGFNCKMKTYNNYVVVSSSNNEVMTTADNIYYAKKQEFNDENSEYHTFNCAKIRDKFEKDNPDNDDYISFTSKEVKYDKMPTSSTVVQYAYDHKNLACYDCINDSNYKELGIFDYSNGDFDKYHNLRKAFYIGVAKERNDIYKMNAVKNSEGFEIIYIKNGNNAPSGESSILDIRRVKEIEVVFGAVNTDLQNENVLTFSVEYPAGSPIGGTLYNPLYSVPTRSTNNYTWKIKVDPNTTRTGKFIAEHLFFNLQNADTSSFYAGNLTATSIKLKQSIREIRIIYK